MRATIAVICIALSLATVDAEARRKYEPLKGTIELFYSEANKVGADKATAIIEDAVNKASQRRVEWAVVKKGQGEVKAEATRGRMLAVIRIKYDNRGIYINYSDSDRMYYRERNGKEFIHPYYNQWSKQLADSIKESARHVANITMVTGEERRVKKALAAGGELVVLAAYAIPATNPMRNTKPWSEKIMASAASNLSDAYSGKLVFQAVQWNKSNIRLGRGGTSKGRNQTACEEYAANKIMTIYIEVDELQGSQASQSVRYSLYDCGDEKLVIYSPYVYYKKGDSFDLESGINVHARKFLRENGL